MNKTIPSVAACLIGATMVCAPLKAYAQPVQESVTEAPKVEAPAVPTTVKKPLTLSLGVGFPDAANISVAYNLNRFLALEAGYGTLGIYKDYGLHARVFPFATERFHTYGQVGVDLMDMTFSPRAPMVAVTSLRIGEEFRANNGFTVGANIGLGVPLNTPEHAVVPTGRLYLGWSF